MNKRWEKMSKSKQNGIDPNLMLDEFGVDTLRLLSMADVAPQSARKWNSQSKFESRFTMLIIPSAKFNI